MKIYNTLTHTIEPLPVPTHGRPLRVFVCGPTVYNSAHIGNARTFAIFDTFVKHIRSQGTKVFYLQNITDIDDKIIARASEEKVLPAQLAKTYTALFKKHMRALNITAVTKYAPATKFISHIIKQVQRLIDTNHAYKIENDGWYFDLTTFPEYGKLARRTIEAAEDGVSRIDASTDKRNRGDFCLWKFSKSEEPSWKAPFGAGRPGWHIEDTAISEYYFGDQYDVHGGASDLIFPHHEAEIAQQESASGKKPFVKLWMHAGFLRVGDEKMSKSLGNFMTIPELLEQYSANVFRFAVASHHYRQTMEFSPAVATQAKQSLATIQEFLAKLALVQKQRNREIKGSFPLESFQGSFIRAMENDLNTPEALAALFGAINAANPLLWNMPDANMKGLSQWITTCLAELGIVLPPLKIPSTVRTLIAKRERFRALKDFAQADAARKDIEAAGWRVEDTPAGPLALPHSH